MPAKEEDFQLFMALLDSDRFEGRYRASAHSLDTTGLMRRMVKEELLTFEGKPLFPERRAETVAYPLSGMEHELYEAVTDYVRQEWSRADALKQAGEGRRGNTVGFALTVLQRRLASSPEAILRSIERRRKKLEDRKQEIRNGQSPTQSSHGDSLTFSIPTSPATWTPTWMTSTPTSWKASKKTWSTPRPPPAPSSNSIMKLASC